MEIVQREAFQSDEETSQEFEKCEFHHDGNLNPFDQEIIKHTQRVTRLTLRLAKQMGVPADQHLHMYRGAILHDIGKIGVPPHILQKPEPLSESEWEIVRRHPSIAYDMLIPFPDLRPALDIPYCHHEKWHGTGYPRGLSGLQIPLAARIFTVVDVWDALISDRPYRKAWPAKRALVYIQQSASHHFDKDVVSAFMQIVRD